MRVLICEDDMAGRVLLQKFLSKFGECDVAIDGLEALDSYIRANEVGMPYDLICLDIMMPKLDGIKVLKAIRDIEVRNGIEKDSRVKIIMTTALNDKKTVMNSYDSGCEAYAWKPIDLQKLQETIKDLGLID